MQAIALEEAETKIRQVAKDEFFKQTRKTAIDKKVAHIVRDALNKIKIPSLRRAAEVSLIAFYARQYAELSRSFAGKVPVITAISALNGQKTDGTAFYPTNRQKAAAWETLERAGYSGARVMGVPMQRFSQDYMRKNVQPALDRLAEQYPYDPDSDMTPQGHRNSLRNRAEFEVRRQGQNDQIADFIARGVRLVICSTHADCSVRCAKYQGRVYSLDGTRGTTDDGRPYVPIEDAINNPIDRYVTKAGRVWQNGLFGFNCRHFLAEYKSGYRFPKPNAELERKERAITETQRRLERNVRMWRTKAVEAKGLNKEAYLNARAKAMEWNDRYIAYSRRNERAYYPSRTKLI